LIPRDVFLHSTLRSPQLQTLARRAQSIVDSRITIGLLLVLGIARAIVFLIAYPPAHGADSTDYFLYAAQFEGLDAPIVFDLIYPFYPLFIYLAHYVLGSIYTLVLIQVALSSLQGVIFYLGFRPYSPALGFLVALMVLGDPQTGILYNFVSTEPLYMPLLNLAFALFLVQIRKKGRRIETGDVVLGVILGLLLLTRPVGRYLIVPFGLLFLLGTRAAWLRVVTLATSFGFVLVASIGFNHIIFDQLELTGGGSFMLNRPVLNSGLLDAGNGAASAQVIELREMCEDADNMRLCLVDQLGDWAAVRKLYADAYQEMLQTRGSEFAKIVVDEFLLFLRKPGLQYGNLQTPSEVQCADIDARVERETRDLLQQDVILFGATDLTPDQLSVILRDMAESMCPPWPDNVAVRRIVRQVAIRYRSLARPHPLIWYGAVGLAVVVIPWGRRLLFPVLMAGAILANHAAISAVVINVQPRYIVVTNPFKGILLLVLVYIAGVIMLRVIDEIALRRAPK
jgi:hypothetical protein